MHDYQDSAAAVQMTASTLRAAGVEPMVIVVGLIVAATRLYREECGDEVSIDDLTVLLHSMSRGDELL